MIRMVDEWGQVTFHGDDVVELLLCDHVIGDLRVIADAVVIEYNQNCTRHNKDAYRIQPLIDPDLAPQQDAIQRQNDWFMPATYRDLDVRALLLARCQRPDEIERVTLEMDLFETAGYLPLLRLMCFLVADWRERGVLWGVGRGSSVASYCLFLIGVHRIDSLRYNLNIREFLR